ncbi:flagellar basal body-associated FliL family protein [Paracoccus sp. p4-l81]|uniref:flagellar basal body-associated FliL family protein n=1 Tax=Paracoccus sp. p4-l81 TaxID=3342806 RepID=UPI0035B9822B
MKKLLPVLIGLIALIGGAAGGWFLHSPAAPEAEAATDAHGAPAAADAHGGPEGGHEAAPTDAHSPPAEGGAKEYVKLNNQFIVPLISGGRVASMVILSISLEVDGGSKEKVFAVEPKLRDTFLRVMFDHANAGGFDGTFTDRSKLDTLRATLAEVSRPLLGDSVSDVLIEDIVRQDNS